MFCSLHSKLLYMQDVYKDFRLQTFHTKISDIFFKNIEGGVLLSSKIRIKNSTGVTMHIAKLLIYSCD